MVKGSFKDISFVEFLQMMQANRKTGRLEVIHENQWVMIIFNEGVIWHVEPRGFRGATSEEILYTLIGMEAANFTFQRILVLPALDRSVQLSTEALIMEGTKRMDDEKATAEIVKEGGEKPIDHNIQVLVFKPGAEAKVRYVPQTVKRILQLIDGQRTLGEVIEQCQLNAEQAAQIIKELVTQEVVELVDAIAVPEEPVAE